MNTRIQHLINNPFEVQLSDVALLQDEIEKYPYFSTLRTLLLFGLKEFDHSTYQEELKKTSIHSPSRVALYHYLQREKQAPSEEIIPEISVSEKEESEFISNDTEEIIESEIFLSEEEFVPAEEMEESIEIQPEIIEKPIVPNSELTFSEWLSLSQNRKQEPEKAPSEKEIKFQLIDEFIEKSPKISPVSKTQEIPSTVKKPEISAEYSDLMTETLALIYTEQKKYDKAIRAYKILSLKYPEKKEIFEDKIAEIENLSN